MAVGYLDCYGGQILMETTNSSNGINVRYYHDYYSNIQNFSPVFTLSMSNGTTTTYGFQYSITETTGLGNVTNGGSMLSLGDKSINDWYTGFDVNCTVNCATDIGSNKYREENLNFTINYSYYIDAAHTEANKVTGSITYNYVNFYYSTNVPTSPALSIISENGNSVVIGWTPIHDDFSEPCIYTVTCNSNSYIYDPSFGYEKTPTKNSSNFYDSNGSMTVTVSGLNQCTPYTVTVKCSTLSGGSVSAKIIPTTTTNFTPLPPKTVNDNESAIAVDILTSGSSVEFNPGFMYNATGTNYLNSYIITGTTVCSSTNSTVKAFVVESIDSQINKENQVALSTASITNVIYGTKFQQQIPSSNQVYYFSIAPNPAKNTITVTMPDDQNTIEIYSMTGIKVFTKTVNSNTVDIDVSAFVSGVYVLKAISSSYSKTVQFVKE